MAVNLEQALAKEIRSGIEKSLRIAQLQAEIEDRKTMFSSLTSVCQHHEQYIAALENALDDICSIVKPYAPAAVQDIARKAREIGEGKKKPRTTG